MPDKNKEKEEIGERVEPKDEQAEVTKAKSENEEVGETVEPKTEQAEPTKY